MMRSSYDTFDLVRRTRPGLPAGVLAGPVMLGIAGFEVDVTFVRPTPEGVV